MEQNHSATKEHWWEYFYASIGNDSLGRAAEKMGISASVLTRWKTGQTPDVHHVVTFARVYGLSVAESLTIAGFIEPGELKKNLLPLSEVPLARLLDEVKRRGLHLEEEFGPIGIAGARCSDAQRRMERIKRQGWGGLV
ncbi:helix-turn-helix transcriptional regulator [Corynebacterium sp. H128]|uniref:helix-turn-helix domain-containing protein n=1 Tax=unclassified Corynebacterium TaxID=2624378 RepID=UPI0030ADB503